MPPPTGRPSLLAPSTLAPVDVELRRVFWAGIALWTLALVVIGVLTVTGDLGGRGVPICLTGIALGFLALGWDRRRRRRAATIP